VIVLTDVNETLGDSDVEIVFKGVRDTRVDPEVEIVFKLERLIENVVLIVLVSELELELVKYPDVDGVSLIEILEVEEVEEV